MKTRRHRTACDERAERAVLAVVRWWVGQHLAYYERHGRLPRPATLRSIPALLAYLVLLRREAASA
jgi:hypothetical protein